jgi:MFS family permease
MTVVARARALPMWRALAVPDFRLLWASEAVSLVGDQFQIIALAWLVISVTGSGLALGTVLIAVAVPRALLLAPFGVLADRLPVRNLMIVAHLGRGAIVALIALLVAVDGASIPILVVLGALFGALDAVYFPAQQAFVPRAVATDRLPSANALLQGTIQLAAVVGPPLAGAAIAVSGTGVAFGVDAASFAIAAALIALISTGTAAAMRAPAATGAADREVAEMPVAELPLAEPAAASDPGHESFLHALRDGLGYVARDPAIRMLMLLSLVLNFALSGPADVGMAWLAQNRFDAGPAGLGLMAAGLAAGGLAGALLAGNTGLDRQGVIMPIGFVVAGLAIAAVGILRWLPGVVAAMATIGIVVGYINVIAISWLQARVAPELLGRVMSLVMLMGFGITPISLGVAGALIDLDAMAVFVGSGILVIATAVLAVVARFPEQLDAGSAVARPARSEAA